MTFISSALRVYFIELKNEQSRRFKHELADLIGCSENIKVLDIGFSSNPNPASKHLLMYSRIISFDDFKMTSGAPLLFDPEHKKTLLDKYKQKMKKVVVGDEQAKMSAAFFQLYQRYGVQNMGYA